MEKAYSLGAVDFLVRPLIPVVVRAKVAGFVELFEKTEQIKHETEQLRQRDRREFEERLAEENARSQESELRFRRQAELILDIQKKASEILGIPLKALDNGGNDL